MAVARWSLIPNSILGAQKLETDAQGWANTQREALASSWASTQRSWLDEMRAKVDTFTRQAPVEEPLATPRLRTEVLASRQPNLVEQAASWAEEQRKSLAEMMGQAERTLKPVTDDLSDVWERTKQESDPRTRSLAGQLGPPGLAPLGPAVMKAAEVVSRPFNAATGVLLDAVEKGPVSPLSPEYLARARQTSQRIGENLAGSRADTFSGEAFGQVEQATAGMPEGPLKTVLPYAAGALGLVGDIAMPGPDIAVAGKVAKGAKALGAVEDVAARADDLQSWIGKSAGSGLGHYDDNWRFVYEGPVLRSDKPQVLYRGEDAVYPTLRPGDGAGGPGVYLSTKRKKAEIFARIDQGEPGVVKEYYTNAKNPLVITANQRTEAKALNKYARENGYDSLFIPSEGEWVVFDPANVRPVTDFVSGSQAGSIPPRLALGGAAATGLVPQQPGESDEVYRIRVGLSGAAGVGLGAMVGKGLLKGRGARPAKSISPTVDRLVDMVNNPPKDVLGGRPFEVGGAAKKWQQFVNAWFDRGAAAKTLQNDLARLAGGKLSADEMFAELQRLDPVKAAEVETQVLRPALQKVGADRGVLSAYMMLVHNKDIAVEMGQKASREVLARPIGKNYAEAVVNVEKGTQRLAEARLAKVEPFDTLNDQYVKVQGQIERLQQEVAELAMQREMEALSSEIIRPPARVGSQKGRRYANLVGLTDQQLEKLARDAGVNPYQPDWWDAIDPVVTHDLKEGGFTRAIRGTKKSRVQKASRVLSESEQELRAAEAVSGKVERQMSASLDLPGQIVERQTKIDALTQRAEKIRVKAEARRAKDAGLKGAKVTAERKFSGGLTIADTDPEVAAIRAKLGPERFAAVEESAQAVFDLNKSMLDRRLASGMLSQEAYDYLVKTYPHYAPTKILKYLEEQVGQMGGSRKLGLSDNLMRRLTEEGTDAAREDPLVSTLRNVYMTEAAVRKNDAFNGLVKLSERAGAGDTIRQVPESFKPTIDDVMASGYVNGELTRLAVPSYLRDAVEREVKAPIPYIGPALSVWRSLVTSRNPAFLSANALLDASTFMIREMTRGGGPQSGGKAALALADAYLGKNGVFRGLFTGEYKGDLAKFLKAGGGLGGMTNITPSSGKRVLEGLQRGSVFELKSTDDVLRLLKDIGTFKWTEAVGERVEMAPRVAAMRLAERRGANVVESAIAGRSVTIDFAQGGYMSKWVNSLVPFFNVSLQAGATLARAAKENPRGFVLTALTMLAVPTVGAEVWNRSDPQRAKDYEDVPQYLKDQGIVFMLPFEAPTDAQGNRHPQYLHIRTREFSPIVMATREAARRAYGDDPRSLQSLIGGVAPSVSPVQSIDRTANIASFENLGGLASQLVPPGLSTAIEIGQNKDFYRGNMIATASKDESASPIPRAAASVLGGRPSQWEYMMRDLGGGVGQMVSSAGNALAGNPNSYAAGVSGVPVGGDFAKRFIRGDIGGQLDRAREELISPEVDRALQQAGVSYVPSPVAREIGGVPLLLTEQAELQQLTNQYVEIQLRALITDPAWPTATSEQRDKEIRRRVALARDRAQAEIKQKFGSAAAARQPQGVR